MNETMRVLMERRSVKSYLDTPVPSEVLAEIAAAGSYAPCGMGKQSPIIVVVEDPAMVKKLSAMNAAVMGSSGDPFYGAPAVMVVLADRSCPTAVEDGSLVMGNLMNAAYALGVDSCWIHRARQEFDSEEGKALLRSWGITGDYVGIGHCILGYRKDEPKPRASRKPDYIHYVR